MSKQCLEISQMQYLKELGVDTRTASLCWVCLNSEPYMSFYNKDYPQKDTKVVPAFTLQDILDLLPSEIECKEEPITYHIKIAFDGDGVWEISYTRNSHVLEYFYHENFIEVAYEMLCWCVENGYLETK